MGNIEKQEVASRVKSVAPSRQALVRVGARLSIRHFSGLLSVCATPKVRVMGVLQSSMSSGGQVLSPPCAAQAVGGGRKVFSSFAGHSHPLYGLLSGVLTLSPRVGGRGGCASSHSAHNESFPGKCATSFTGSRPGRFLCGSRIKCREMTGLFFARTGAQTDFTLLPFAFAPHQGATQAGVTGKGFSCFTGHPEAC